MKNSQEILNELRSISPMLASLEKINVFGVPNGYFDELPFRITNYAILNNTSPVENINKRNFQEVPDGYFNSLSDSILAKVKSAYTENNEEELRNLSRVLYNLKDKNVFTFPKGYFENLSNSILEKIAPVDNAEEELHNLSPLLYDLKNENVFSVPSDYFHHLSNSILEKTSTENAGEELLKLSQTLYSLKSKNVFSVPKGYFESLSENVIKNLNPVSAKVVSMKKRTSWLRYAAAAVIASIITIVSFQLFNNTSHTPSQYAYLPDYIKASFQYKTDADINAGIAKLDDADIAKYLEKNGNVLDNELLTNNTDVSEMPNSTDYLIDDNTLNEYLDKIDNSNVTKTTP